MSACAYERVMRVLVALLVLLYVNGLPTTGGPVAYFVDANSGSDNNDGGSPTSAFKTLKKMNGCVFLTGAAVTAPDARRGKRCGAT